MAVEKKYTIYGVEYIVRLVRSRFRDPLNLWYDFVFECTINGNQSKKMLGIFITGQVIDLWDEDLFEKDKGSFAFQLIPSFLLFLDDKEKLKVVLHSSDDIKKEEDTTYFKVLPSMMDTARVIVFAQNPSNALIRREILNVLFQLHQFEPYKTLDLSDLYSMIPIHEHEMIRNLKYLHDGEYIKLESSLITDLVHFSNIQITNKGLDIVEDPDEFNKKFASYQTQISVVRDFVLTKVEGDGNNTNVNSKVEQK